jgi:hypothetical protein
VLTAEQAAALTTEGEVIWRDAIFDDPKNLHAQLISDKYIVVIGWDVPPMLDVQNAVGNRQPRINIPADRRHNYRLYVLDRANGMILRQQQLGPAPQAIDPAACLILDDQILLGVGEDKTIFIPGR